MRATGWPSSGAREKNKGSLIQSTSTHKHTRGFRACASFTIHTSFLAFTFLPPSRRISISTVKFICREQLEWRARANSSCYISLKLKKKKKTQNKQHCNYHRNKLSQLTWRILVEMKHWEKIRCCFIVFYSTIAWFILEACNLEDVAVEAHNWTTRSMLFCLQLLF